MANIINYAGLKSETARKKEQLKKKRFALFGSLRGIKGLSNITTGGKYNRSK